MFESDDEYQSISCWKHFVSVVRRRKLAILLENAKQLAFEDACIEDHDAKTNLFSAAEKSLWDSYRRIGASICCCYFAEGALELLHAIFVTIVRELIVTANTVLSNDDVRGDRPNLLRANDIAYASDFLLRNSRKMESEYALTALWVSAKAKPEKVEDESDENFPENDGIVEMQVENDEDDDEKDDDEGNLEGTLEGNVEGDNDVEKLEPPLKNLKFDDSESSSEFWSSDDDDDDHDDLEVRQRQFDEHFLSWKQRFATLCGNDQEMLFAEDPDGIVPVCEDFIRRRSGEDSDFIYNYDYLARQEPATTVDKVERNRMSRMCQRAREPATHSFLHLLAVLDVIDRQGLCVVSEQALDMILTCSEQRLTALLDLACKFRFGIVLTKANILSALHLQGQNEATATRFFLDEKRVKKRLYWNDF